MAPSTNVNVIFGAMSFGAENTLTARVTSPEDCQKILDVVKKHGVEEIDSARFYGGGSCEEFLSQMKVEQQGFKVATKVFGSKNSPLGASLTTRTYTLGGSKDPDGLSASLNDSLKALNTSQIDLFYLHAPDRTVPLAETLEAADAEYKLGKFKRFGISNFNKEEVVEIMELCKKNGWVKPTVYQGLYNCIVRGGETVLLPTLRKYGLSYYCYNPIGGGLFTGAIQKDQEVAKGSRYDADHLTGKTARGRYWKDEYFNALDLIRPVSEKHNLTMAEIALRWMMHHSALKKENGDAVIVGASSTNHIEQNLLDFEKGPLDQEVVQAVEQAWKLVEKVAPGCHW